MKEVAQFFLENIVLRPGAPSIVTTNRGTTFKSRLMESAMTLSGTCHRKTTAYHPQTNKLTERPNKTIADMLCMYEDVDHKSWDTILPYVTFAYNTVQQETTRMTPFRLVDGRGISLRWTQCCLTEVTTLTAPQKSHTKQKKHGNLLACALEISSATTPAATICGAGKWATTMVTWCGCGHLFADAGSLRNCFDVLLALQSAASVERCDLRSRSQWRCLDVTA